MIKAVGLLSGRLDSTLTVKAKVKVFNGQVIDVSRID